MNIVIRVMTASLQEAGQPWQAVAHVYLENPGSVNQPVEVTTSSIKWDDAPDVVNSKIVSEVLYVLSGLNIYVGPEDKKTLVGGVV